MTFWKSSFTNFFLLGLVVTTTLLLVILRITKWLRTYAQFRYVEQSIDGPLSLPIIGTVLYWFTLARAENSLQTFQTVFQPYWPKLARFSLLKKLYIVINDADHIEKVLRSRDLTSKPWMFYGVLKGVLMDGIFTNNGPIWEAHRAAITPAFHRQVLEGYVDILKEESLKMTAKLSNFVESDVDCREIMTTCTSTMSVRTILSSTIDEEDQSDVDELIEELESIIVNVNRRSVNPFLWPEWIFKRTNMYHKEIKYNEKFTKLMRRIIHRKTTEINQSATRLHTAKLGFKDRKSVLDILLEGKSCGEPNMTADDILIETCTMFGTAIHTPPLLVTFILKVLSIRPDIQERVYAEICNVFHDERDALSYDDLSRLQYMERVIKETLRMFPVGPLLLREVKNDMELGNKEIPAGSILVLNLIGVHRSARYHKDPLHFDPDRFLPERVSGIHPYSFLPFSSGPRNCIGQPMAWMMVKMLLVTTLKAFEIFPAADGIRDPSQFEITMDLMIQYVGGAKVRLAPRKDYLLQARG